MAGLMDELVSTLDNENTIYEELIPLAESKTRIIISNDLSSLEEVTEKEQLAIEHLHALEKKREEIMANMRIVLAVRKPTLSLSELIDLMAKQPDSQKKLVYLRKQLKGTIERLKVVNDRNEKLIAQSLEISEFQLNTIRSSRSYIGNNYTRKAGQFNMNMLQSGTFDTRN